MKLNKLVLTLIAGSIFFVSCNNDDDTNDVPQGAYDNGVLILNEGGFMAGNASVSYLSEGMQLQNNIYGINNSGNVLGDTGQDIGLNGDYAYIVLNFSNKIEVVNRYTFAHVATIEDDLINPRYIAFEGGKAYVTNWGDGTSTSDDYVAVINLATNLVTVKIPVAEGPERILEEDGKLYVAHKGGYGSGKTVTVINGASNTITATITVGDLPGEIEIEDNKLYLLNEGKGSFSGGESAGSLSVINLNNNTVASTITFPGLEHPSNLVIEDDIIYYTLGADVYSMPKNSTALPTVKLFSTSGQDVSSIYAFAVEDNHIYVADAGDFASAGKVYVYSLTGALEQSLTVGVIPSGFYFND